MSSKRLTAQDRCPGAVFLCVAELPQYSFSFNKKSKRGICSGKGNITFTGNSSNKVWGVVFEIPNDDEETALDKAKGFVNGHYFKESIKVYSNNEEIDVTVYIAKKQELIDTSEIPFNWYKNHCIKGAIEFNLPKDYIKFLESFESKQDKYKNRSDENFSIYNKS